ncbi:MAG: prepilin-type N-terminal cleavage/methylation domain-containing protein [Phycisphaeraceae bacterium]|nr:prepilin-type N-terminal cleavage/methylation domain-containing protein [Phycisphaeraceae bacterium]
MRRGFTLLEVLLALALTALAAGVAAAVLVPMMADAPAAAADLESRSRAQRALDRIGHDLFVEHESLPRRRVVVGDGWLTIETRSGGQRTIHRSDAPLLGVEGFEAKLKENGRRLVVRITDGGRDIVREYRVP